MLISNVFMNFCFGVKIFLWSPSRISEKMNLMKKLLKQAELSSKVVK